MSLDDREALSNFIDSMRSAEEAARAMAFTQDQPAWLLVVEKVSLMRELATKLATTRTSRIMLPERYQ